MRIHTNKIHQPTCIKYRSFLPFFFMLLFFFSIQAPIVAQLITTTANGNNLAQTLTGNGVTISNVVLDCNAQAAATFSNGSTTNIGLDKGILLTSGSAALAKGPNDKPNANAQAPNNFGDEVDLLSLINGASKINDRCVLEFDLIPIGDKVTFKYVFASEEYPEYVCSQYNDVFGFFVSGPGITGTYSNNAINIALIPGTNLPVAINTINPGVPGSTPGSSASNCSGPSGSLAHSGLYRDNTSGTSIQYDGFTIVLTATIDLVPCQTYHFKLAIADAADKVYDSGVFIEAGSFNSNEILATGTITAPDCPSGCDAKIDITTAGGAPPYTYAWSNGKSTKDITNLCSGIYTLTITDNNNCTEELSFNVQDGTDITPPVINCLTFIEVSASAGDCGQFVNYNVTATDDCTANVSINCGGFSSGDFFPVGVTYVNCIATDDAGNSTTCSFPITVKDEEAPQVTCPSTIDLSCEIASTPDNTGTPLATDNCQVGQVTYSDSFVVGDCPAEFIVTRTWTIRDIHNNVTTCEQTINIIDNTPPIIVCVQDTTVACDTTALTGTGMSIATDNCDPNPVLTYVDKNLMGDCEWNCIIERTWTATDNCGNTSECIQLIEKDVTPIIEDILSLDLDGDGVTDTLVLGQPGVSLTIAPGNAACIIKWYPNHGGKPRALIRRGDEVVIPDCIPGTNPIDSTGNFANPLLAEALKFNLYLRAHPEYGDVIIKDVCEIPSIIKLFLKTNDDMNDLQRLATIALKDVVLTPHLKELTELLACINGNFTVCD